MQQQRQTRPILARSGPPVKPRRHTASGMHRLRHPEHPLLRPPGAPPPRLRRPTQTQMGPKGPRSGPGGRRLPRSDYQPAKLRLPQRPATKTARAAPGPSPSRNTPPRAAASPLHAHGEGRAAATGTAQATPCSPRRQRQRQERRGGGERWPY
jgi:hypothetical protein